MAATRPTRVMTRIRLAAALAPLAVLALVSASCASGSPASGSSGVSGIVRIGPMCPVERAGSPCPDKPYSTQVDVLDANANTVATTHSGSDGTFRVAVPPGSYTVAAVTPTPGGLPHGSPVRVTVTEGTYSNVTLTLDSGIR